MTQVWKNWCRLCGKENAQIDVFVKDKNFSTLAEAVRKFFSIDIYNYDEAPTKICKRCHQFLYEIIHYFLQAHKVQEMFCDLQFNQEFDIAENLNEIRAKYGICIIQEKHLEFKSEFQNKYQSPKYTINYLNELPKNDCKIEISSEIDSATTYFDQKSIMAEDDTTESNSRLEEFDSVENNENPKLNSESNHNNCVTYKVEDRSSYRKLQNYHRKRGKYKKNINEDDANKEPVAVCELCNKKFLNKGGYTLHLKAKHSLTTEPISCKFCGKLFKAISDHQKHETTHLPSEERRTFPCGQCDKKFFSEGNLNAHIKVVHVREKTFICEECGKGYVTVDALNSHKVVHTEEKPFECSKCTKSFKRLPTLKLHLESHANHKFICSICGTQLNSRALLRRHMVVHSDEKKYKCNFCEKEFKRPDAFKHHLILHTGLKPYECPFCELTFANGSNCRKHQKTTHPIELAAAEAEGVKRICKNVPKIEQLRAVNNGALTDCETE